MATSPPSANVAVLIPAYDREDSIGRAVRSALGQQECAELVVVDDGSHDRTAQAALSADDGTGRLRVIRQSNRGPSAALNHAHRETTQPLVCVLDADDYFLPGRLGRLLKAAGKDWDMAADRLCFEDESSPGGPRQEWLGQAPASGVIDFSYFVRGNISHPSRPRAELGFLQPVYRRSFVDGKGLSYDETLRLGEDYVFYATALAQGARLRVVEYEGYVATVRRGSLSSNHSKADLAGLLQADRRMATKLCLTADERRALSAHIAHIGAKLAQRRALDAKAEHGLVFGFATAIADWPHIPYMIAEAVRARRAPRPRHQAAWINARTTADGG